MKFVKAVEVHEEDDNQATAVIRFSQRMEVLSSAPYNGGHDVTDTVFIMQVPHKFNCVDYLSVLREKAAQYSLPEDSVGFMTSAEVKYVFSQAERTVDDTAVFVAATAGVTNCVRAGEPLTDWDRRTARSDEIYRKLIGGTINVIAVVPFPLTEAGKVNAFIPLVEAKTLAMRDRGYTETGTTSDAMAVISPAGEDRCEFTGTGTEIGMALAQGVRETVAECLRKRGESAEPRDTVSMLKHSGVTEEMLWDCASACGLSEELKGEFDDVIASMGSDADISALVYGILETGSMSDKGCISNQTEGEPPEVLIDGTLSMFLAGRISETRGSDSAIDLMRMKPLKDCGLSEYLELTVYGFVAGVVGYITGYSDE